MSLYRATRRLQTGCTFPAAAESKAIVGDTLLAASGLVWVLPMTAQMLQLELDQKATGQILESLAERLLRLETLREGEVDEDTFADAKNDALALRPLYAELRRRAERTYGRSILSESTVIARLEALYHRK
jgi:hypothetical protein